MKEVVMVNYTERTGLKKNAYTYRVLVGTRKESDHLLELGTDGWIVLIWEGVEWIILS
jgi:hypothetical protein